MDSAKKQSKNNVENDLISIIIPVYNCEKYIKDTIQSVCQQTYKNWEMIIVNDCSKDKSLEIARENVADITEKVKVIGLKQNSGVAIARNEALKVARGEFIAYLDGDDLWKKDKLKKQVKFMKSNNYNFTYTKYEYLKEDGKTKEIKIFPKSLTYKQSLKNTVILTSTVMINRQLLDEKLLIMPNIRRGQDTATWWQILKEGNTAWGLDEVFTAYRRQAQSLSFNKVKAIKRTWNLYRNVEKFGIIKSAYYFLHYAVNAKLRRIV